MSRASEPSRTAPSARLYIAGLLMVCAAAALGLVIGKASANSSALRAPTPANAAGARMRAGIPVEFPDSAAGAAAAVAAYQRGFASPAILRAGVLRERIEAVATPSYVAKMVAANSPGEERLAAGPIGQGLASGLQTVYAAVPIGYRVQSFSPQRARILTWGFTLLGNASAVEPSAYFGLTHTELHWSEGQWRIAETRAGFGPTPKLATAPGPLDSYNVIDVATRLKSYELTP